MQSESLVRNPFMLMLSPADVLAAVQRSEKLGRLNRRMCHPLDQPQQMRPDGWPRAVAPNIPHDG